MRPNNSEDSSLTETTPTETKGNPLLMRFILLIVLIIMLIAVNYLYQPVSNWNSVQTGEPGELVYAAGFDGFEDEWLLFEGRQYAQITDGVLRLGLESPGTFYSSSTPGYTDFDMTVTTRAIEGELANDGYGVIFRLSENNAEQACTRQFVIVCNLEQIPLMDTAIGLLAPAPQSQASGYYLFMISNDGYYRILRVNSNNDAEEMTVWHYSNGLLNEGIDVENRIRIVGQGNQFIFFLNGEPALLCVPLEGQQPTGDSANCLGEETFVWEDDSFPRGKMGVVISGTNDVVEFDDFTVTIPDEIIIEGNNA